MALDDRTAQEKLTPEERRKLLRAFGDRMLLKVTAMDDPEDMPGVERCARVAAVIERLYSRCDRAEVQAPDPRKLEADRARHSVEAIQTRVALANTLAWGEKRRKEQGRWWDDAQAMAQNQPQDRPQAITPAPDAVQVESGAETVIETAPETAVVPVESLTTEREAVAPESAVGVEPVAPVFGQALETAQPFTLPEVEYVDYTDAIRSWRVELGLPESSEEAFEEPEPPPPS